MRIAASGRLGAVATEREQAWTRPALVRDDPALVRDDPAFVCVDPALVPDDPVDDPALSDVPVWTRPLVAPQDAPALPATARFEARPDAPTVVVSAIGTAEGARAAAAALACAGADRATAPLLVDLGGGAPRPTLVASAAARALEERLAAHLPTARVAARGEVCHLAAAADGDGFAVAAAAVTVARGALAVVHAPPDQLQALLSEAAAPAFSGALLRADLGRDRALLALVVRDLFGRGLAVSVLKRRLGWVTERRALFGALGPGGAGLPPALLRRLAQYGEGYGFGGGAGS